LTQPLAASLSVALRADAAVNWYAPVDSVVSHVPVTGFAIADGTFVSSDGASLGRRWRRIQRYTATRQQAWVQPYAVVYAVVQPHVNCIANTVTIIIRHCLGVADEFVDADR